MIMTLTSVLILAFGCWQFSSVLAYPAGTHPGGRYHPWSNNPSLGTPWEPNDNIGRHVVTGRPGPKDKGKEKASSSQDPLERPPHRLMLPEEIPFSVDELLNAPYDFQYLPSTLWRPVEGNRPGHGLAEMESRPIAGHYPRSDEDVGQPMTPPSHVSNVSQSHHNDPLLQHLQWLGYQNVQYQQQPSGIQKVEGRWSPQPSGYTPLWNTPSAYHHLDEKLHQSLDKHNDQHRRQGLPHASAPRRHHVQRPSHFREKNRAAFHTEETRHRWQAFNKDILLNSFRHAVVKALKENIPLDRAVESDVRFALHRAGSSWVASVVDNPFGPVEGRVYFSDPEQHAFVSQWANAERVKLAATSPTHDLRYMRFNENTQRWIMKREIVSGKEVVKAAPDDWWPSTEKSRVIVFKERVEKDTKKRRERREMQRQEASRGSGHSGRARSR